MNKVLVLGSVNTDYSIEVKKFPQIGETVNGADFKVSVGGKGANQAVACCKLGCKTYLVGAVGDDENGKFCLNAIKKYGVDVGFVDVVSEPTGCAFVIVENANNRIIVNKGSNALARCDVLSDKIARGDVLVVQGEVDSKSTLSALKIAKERGAITILNPAPVSGITEEMLSFADLIIPNETETQSLTGITPDTQNLKACEERLKAKGVGRVIITLGEKGCYYNGKIYPPVKVKAVDTTSAGDTFIGALANRLIAGFCVEEAIEFCQKACAVTVSRRGAMDSIPYLNEII